jgi:hypothetical protein
MVICICFCWVVVAELMGGEEGNHSHLYQTNVGGPSSATQIFFANKIHIQVSHSQEFDGLIPAGNFLDPKKFHGANLTNGFYLKVGNFGWER